MTNREAFEAWFNQFTTSDGEVLLCKESASRAWQAATKHQDAMIAAAIKKSADIVTSRANADNNVYAPSCVEEILSISAVAALREFGLKVAKQSRIGMFEDDKYKQEVCKAILDEALKGE